MARVTIQAERERKNKVPTSNFTSAAEAQSTGQHRQRYRHDSTINSTHPHDENVCNECVAKVGSVTSHERRNQLMGTENAQVEIVIAVTWVHSDKVEVACVCNVIWVAIQRNTT